MLNIKRSFSAEASLIYILVIIGISVLAYFSIEYQKDLVFKTVQNRALNLVNSNANYLVDINDTGKETVKVTTQATVKLEENLLDIQLIDVEGNILLSSGNDKNLQTTADIQQKIKNAKVQSAIPNYNACITYQNPEDSLFTLAAHKFSLNLLKYVYNDNLCPPEKTLGMEILYPKLGENSTSVKYTFIYADIFIDLFLSFCLYLIIFSLFTVIFIFSLIKIGRPLRTIRQGAFSMASGNLKHRIHVKNKNEIGVIANFMNEVSRNLEKVIGDLNEKERLSSELDVASKIQQNLLPKEDPDIPGLEIAGKTKSSTEVGGDNFGYIRTNEDNLLIYIGDVTGHGVPACLIMIMIDILIHTFSDMFKNTKDIMINVNRNLHPRIDATLFMTMLMLNWNVTQQRLTFTSAGHEHILHYHAKTGLCSATRSGGIALGMVPDIDNIAIEKEIKLDPEDVIILYTDGITEARNEKEEMFGLKRLIEAVEMHGNKNAKGIHDRVTKILGTFMERHPQEDDITLIVLKYKGAQKEDIENSVQKAKLSLTISKKREKRRWDWD